MREAIALLFGAKPGTHRIAPAQITFENLLPRSYVNSPKGTGIRTGKTLRTMIIIDDHRPGVFVYVHGIGNWASFLTGRVLAVLADYGERERVFLRMTDLYPCQCRVNHPRVF
jgi:hypothetical protein